MIKLHGRHLQRLVWFLAGLLCTVLFSLGMQSIWQPASAASDIDAVNRYETYESTSFVAPSFEQTAASHLEPNFYQ